MKKINKIVAVTGIAAFVFSALPAYAEEENTDKIKVVAATYGQPAPYIYNDDGHLYGYDIEVLEDIFSRLPQYELEWQVTDFASIFTGIDAGYYQLGVNHLGYNKERAEKYTYLDVMAIDPTAILVKDDNEDIKSIYDLPGHSTEAGYTSFYTTAFENYNKANPDAAIDIKYVDNVTQTPLHISDGIVDFELFTKTTLLAQIEDLGLDDLKVIDVPKEDHVKFLYGGEVPIPQGTYYIAAKGEDQLVDDINKAFEEAVEDGTVQKLGEKYLGVTDETALTLEDIEEQRALIEKDLSNAE